jgi:RNA polymerase sigma-70 factor (ECF subfamily)
MPRAWPAGAERPFAPEDELAILHPASFGWALGCCNGDRGEAEDVLQAAYVKVLEGRARFDGGSSFRTWLFAVIRRTAAERRRARWTRALALDRWFAGRGPAATEPDPEQTASGSETARRLRDSLRSLPARQRELLHLVFYQDLSLEEAARVAGVSLGTARTHYHRGKERLRRLLDQR